MLFNKKYRPVIYNLQYYTNLRTGTKTIIQFVGGNHITLNHLKWKRPSMQFHHIGFNRLKLGYVFFDSNPNNQHIH